MNRVNQPELGRVDSPLTTPQTRTALSFSRGGVTIFVDLLVTHLVAALMLSIEPFRAKYHVRFATILKPFRLWAPLWSQKDRKRSTTYEQLHQDDLDIQYCGNPMAIALRPYGSLRLCESLHLFRAQGS